MEPDELRLREEQLTWREIGGEIVAADLERATYLNTNEAGTLLWSALSSGATPAQLAGLLVDEYGIDRERAAADVEAFLASLREQGLLRE